MTSDQAIGKEARRRLRAISLRQLLYFVEVARKANFTKAAESLAISQPTLSQQVRQLEETLGVVLIKRDKGEFVLTEAGRIMLEGASDAMKALDETIDSLPRPDDGETLRIGLPAHMSYRRVTDILERLRIKHRSIIQHFAELPALEMAQQLLAGKIDAAFLSLPTPIRFPATIRKLMISSDVLHLCLSKADPLARKPVIQAKDCSQIRFILFPRSYHEPEFDKQLTSIAKLCPDPQIIHSDVVSARAHIELAAAGMGACLISADADNLSDSVALRPTDPPLAKHELAMFYNSRNPSPQLQRFVSLIQSDSARRVTDSKSPPR